MQDADQWLSTGNCDMCRRQKYCKKTCKAAATRNQRRSAIKDMVVMMDIWNKAATMDIWRKAFMNGKDGG